MLNTFKHLLLTLSLCSLLGACKFSGTPKDAHQISLDQTSNYGFTNTEIVKLGRLVLIDYAQFEADADKANPNFPSPNVFPNDSNLLSQYSPQANIQGRDKVGSSQEELYGHVWLDQSNAGLVISIRGTSDRQEWIDDAKFLLTKLNLEQTIDPASKLAKNTEKAVKVELGFHEIESSFTVSTEPGTKTRTSLTHYLDKHPNIESLTIVGHSLGSSLATIFAYKTKLRRPNLDIRLLTFASPLTGAPNFSHSFETLLSKSIRIVNSPDIVPRMPFPELGYKHVWHPLFINSNDNKGIVDSIACHHSLNTYLHMLDKTVDLTESCSITN